MAKMIDPQMATVLRCDSNQRGEWRTSSAPAPSSSTTTVLGAIANHFPVPRLDAIRLSTRGPRPNTRSAANATVSDRVTIASIDVTRGTQKATAIKASPQATNPMAEVGGVGMLSGNSLAYATR